MAELDDIRRMLDPRDLSFIKSHSKSLHAGQVIDVTSRRYGGSESCKIRSRVLQFGAAAVITCAVVLAGMVYFGKKK